MSFHRNLTGQDLHAPTILPIENDGTTGITKGEVLVVRGYNPDNKRYRVVRTQDIGLINAHSPIFGIALETLAGSFDKGRMVTFGIAEDISVLLTKNNVADEDTVPLRVGNTIYVDDRALLPGTTDPNPNVGRLVSGRQGGVLETAIIIEVISDTSATIFFYGLATGIVGNSPDRASLVNIEFDTDEDQAGEAWDPNTPVDGEKTGTIVHNLDTTGYVVQWYETTYEGTTIVKTEPIDLFWQVDGANALRVILPFGLREQRIRGYVELVY